MGDSPLSDSQFYLYLVLALGTVTLHFALGPSKSRRSSLLLLAMCGLWFVWSMSLGFRSEIKFRDALVGLISYCAILFVVLNELLMNGGSAWLIRKRGENWTREIDYVYLGLGAIGLMISISQLNIVSDKLQLPSTLGPVALATALILRTIKTRAEIGGWNKLPPKI
jgi:hypothetical protein